MDWRTRVIISSMTLGKAAGKEGGGRWMTWKAVEGRTVRAEGVAVEAEEEVGMRMKVKKREGLWRRRWRANSTMGMRWPAPGFGITAIWVRLSTSMVGG